MGDYKKLRVWTESHQFTLATYSATAKFPSAERFGLMSQLRRSAVSIGANVAEGCGRDTDGELARFLRVALGSANESEYHLLLARDLGFLTPREWASLHGELQKVRRMLAGLVEHVQPFRERSRKARQPTADG